MPFSRPLFALASVTFSLILLAACSGERRAAATALTGGDPEAGLVAIGRYGCTACHTIPGVAKGGAAIGPPLRGIERRPLIAGKIEHTPENLILFIQHPQKLIRYTSMPDIGVGEQDARDIAAYLYFAR